MKKVMVVGAGRGQIPVMDLCHKYGCKVIAVSPKGNYPGLNVADEICYQDVKDKEQVLELARKYEVEAIVTDQLDAGVVTVAYVAEKIGLRGITYDIAIKFTNKFFMRQAAEKAGIAVPKFICASSVDELIRRLEQNEELQFPLMMKPIDSAASRGVYKVHSIYDIQQKFDMSQQYSKSKKVILEQFIVGKEYVVEAYTRNKVVKNLIVGHRDYFNVEDTFIPNATVFTDADSANSAVELKLKETNEKLIEHFGLEFGITHGEYLYVEELDTVYLVEIAARGGGVFISSDLIPAACGINANELLVQDVLGISNKEEITLKKGASAYFCYLTPEGVINKIEGIDEVENIEGVYKAFFDNIELGMVSKSIRDKSSRKGPILVQGKSKEECYKIIEKVKELIDIEVDGRDGKENIIWN